MMGRKESNQRNKQMQLPSSREIEDTCIYILSPASIQYRTTIGPPVTRHFEF